MEATVQNIFLLGYSAYEQMHRLPLRIRKAAENLMSCRTSALGGHVQACPDNHFKRVWYNSCKHRICPLCAYTRIERWLIRQEERILNTDHFHVIFTISDELHDLWRWNSELMVNLLFNSATGTLFELLDDPKYLGARPGIIASLHTWTKTLMLHPHVHCLVTGGGLSDGKWIRSSRKYLLPFRVVRKLFRGKFIASIRKSLYNGDLDLPEGMSVQKLENLLNKLGRKKWNVHLKETYSHGHGVLIYLSRYLRGGPISNKRIVQIHGGEVVFNYGREKRQLMTLSIHDFLHRFLQHVPGENSIRIRSYGLYHHHCIEKLELCRQFMGQDPIEDLEFIDWQTLCDDIFENNPGRCPVCGKRLVAIQIIPGSKTKYIGEVYKTFLSSGVSFSKAA